MLDPSILCGCAGRAKPEEVTQEDSDFLDLYDAKQEAERMQEEWQWLSIRCERRLHEKLRFYQQEMAERCDAVHSQKDTPAPPSAFMSYVPRLISKYIKDHIGRSEKDAHEFSDGYAVAMFCDVSGFTALAEAIDRSGDPQAAATLGRSLNRFFDPLICIINRWGGDIIKFAGDAVLVAWFVKAHNDDRENKAAQCPEEEQTEHQGSNNEPSKENAWKQCVLALKCCDELHGTLHEFPTGIENKTFTMHIGVGFGKASIVHVGGMMDRWEFVLAGQPIEEIAVAEPLASKGETVISRSVYDVMKDNVKVSQIEGEPEYFLFGGFTEPVSMELDEEETQEVIDFPQEAVTSFRHYMPNYIFFRLMSGYSVFNNEMRRISTVFVSVPGLDVVSPSGRQTLEQLMNVCQRTTCALEGSLNKFLVDDKGAVLLIFMGFPPVYHTDDPVRSVFVGLKIAHDCAKLGLSPGVGITTGYVWCGTLGNDIRKEYTCLGDYVNLAARLMSKAAAPKGYKILVDETTARAAGTFLEFKELEPVKVKGKEAWTKIYTPTGKVRKHDSHDLGDKTPLETWKQWDAYKTTKECLGTSGLLEHGGLMLIKGHRGCGTQDLQAAIKRFVMKQGYTNCFSLSTIKEDTHAISIAVDSNCPWRDLLNGLVSTWGSSPSRKAMVSAYDSRYLYVQSDHCVSKRVVVDVVKELLDPALHWRMGTLKPLIMGLEVEPLRNVLSHSLKPCSNKKQGLSGMLQSWMGGAESADSDAEGNSDSSDCNVKSENYNACDITLLEKRIMQEPIAPFVASMVDGFSRSNAICIILNIRRGSAVYAGMDDRSWATISEISNLAMKRRHDHMAGEPHGKPILFIVVSCPQYIFVDWYEELMKHASECNAYIELSRMDRNQLVEFIAHCINLEGSSNVPQELLDHVYKNTCGMAQFVYKTLEKLLESGAIVLEDVKEGSSSDTEDDRSAANRLLGSTDIMELFTVPRVNIGNHAVTHERKDLGISLGHHLRGKKRLVSVNLEGVGFIDEISAFAMSVVDRLKAYELFVAKVACLLPEPFVRRDLLGTNPHGLGDEQFDEILKSLIANEVLEAVGSVSSSEGIGAEVELRLCSNAMSNILLQRVLEEEREWFAKHFSVG